MSPRINPTSSDHPIAARLEVLHEQWISFSRAVDARLLVWCATHAERALVDCFVAREERARTAATHDVFVRLEEPFLVPRDHGAKLVHALREQVALLTDRPVWSPPPPPPSDSAGTLRAFLDAVGSLRGHLGLPRGAVLALWLDPSETCAADAYRHWLHALACCLPPHVRIIAVDDVQNSQIASLARADPRRVHRVSCALDLPTALASLAQRADDGSPGARLRVAEMRLAAIADARVYDAAAAEAVTAEAEALASAAGWPTLAASMRLMLAGVAIGHGARRDAFLAYRQAAAHAMTATGGPGASSAGGPREGARLAVIACFGAAAILLAEGAFAEAAAAYESTAALARESADVPGELSAVRMASACHEADGAADAAWEAGIRGLARAHACDASRDTLAAPALAQLGAHVVGLSGRVARFASRRAPLEARLCRLFGPGFCSFGGVGEVGRLEGSGAKGG